METWLVLYSGFIATVSYSWLFVLFSTFRSLLPMVCLSYLVRYAKTCSDYRNVVIRWNVRFQGNIIPILMMHRSTICSIVFLFTHNRCNCRRSLVDNFHRLFFFLFGLWGYLYQLDLTRKVYDWCSMFIWLGHHLAVTSPVFFVPCLVLSTVFCSFKFVVVVLPWLCIPGPSIDIIH